MRWRILFAGLCAVLALAATAGAQVQTQLLARRRFLPEVGAGVRAIKRDAAGRYFVLTAPAAAVLIYNAAGQRVGQVPAAAGAAAPVSKEAALVYGDDLDVDPTGWIYVADRGANAVKVFKPDGTLAVTIAIVAPTSVAALAEGEIAVASMKSARLVTVFAGPSQEPVNSDGAARASGEKEDAGHGAGRPATAGQRPGNVPAPGKVVREFGDPTEIAERGELNRFLNVGRLANDAASHLYYAFNYLPEPTVRKYDRYGYAALEISLSALEFQPAAQAARREIERQEKKSGAPTLKPIVTAVGVDPATQEIWVALGGLLLHFDRAGDRRASYRTFTPEGARLEATAILVEPDRLLLAADPLGIYEFPRPDKTLRLP